MLIEIQKEGAEAARKGLSLLSCPYLKADAMPGHTGECPREWIERVNAWEEGWKREVAQRGAKRSTSPFAVSVAERRPGFRLPAA